MVLWRKRMKGLRREELVPWPSFSFCMLLSSIACPRLQNFTQLGRFWLFYGDVPKPEEELPRKFFFNEPTPFDFYLSMIFIFSPLSCKLFTQIIFFSLLQQIYLISGFSYGTTVIPYHVFCPYCKVSLDVKRLNPTIKIA